MNAEADNTRQAVSQGSWSVDPALILEIAVRETEDLAGIAAVVKSEVAKSALSSGIFNRLRKSNSGELKTADVPLELTIIADYGTGLPELCKKVRQRVARTVEGMTGYRVTSVDLTVADLHLPGEPLPSRLPLDAGKSQGGERRIDF
jgi:uncharacterized alkaline shock family protein YloU